MVRISFIISLALAAQGILAAPAEKSVDVQTSGNVMPQANDISNHTSSTSVGSQIGLDDCPAEDNGLKVPSDAEEFETQKQNAEAARKKKNPNDRGNKKFNGEDRQDMLEKNKQTAKDRDQSRKDRFKQEEQKTKEKEKTQHQDADDRITQILKESDRNCFGDGDRSKCTKTRTAGVARPTKGTN